MSRHKLDQARRVRFMPLDRKGNPLPKREQARIEREQQEGDRRRAEARASERQQSELIEQFERQQLETRDWISFAEIIDWRARQDTNGVPNADNEKIALDDLWREVSAGVIFYTDGRSNILLTSLDYELTDALLTDLSALPATAWVTQERWIAWREIHSDDTLDHLLRSCWVPCNLCLKFAASIPFQSKSDWIRTDRPRDDDGKACVSRKSDTEYVEPSKSKLGMPKQTDIKGRPFKLPRRPPGPNPILTTSAEEKLRNMLRSGEITQAKLVNPIKEGGLKQEDLAKKLGVESRTTAKKVVERVLSEPEFSK